MVGYTMRAARNQMLFSDSSSRGVLDTDLMCYRSNRARVRVRARSSEWCLTMQGFDAVMENNCRLPTAYLEAASDA